MQIITQQEIKSQFVTGISAPSEITLINWLKYRT